VQLDHLAPIVLDHVGATDEAGVAQSDLGARRQAEPLLRRVLHEVIPLDVDHLAERHLARSHRRVVRVVRRLEPVDLPLGVVVDDHLERPQHRQGPRRPLLEILADGEFEQPDVHQAVVLGHADPLGEGANGLGCVAAPAQPRERRHARVVPAADQPLVHELQEAPLAHQRVGQVEPGELDLPRPRGQGQVLDAPVVERAVVLELEGADRVGDPLERVGDGMRVVVHRVEAPRVAGPVMVRLLDPVERRVAHVQVRVLHVDLGAQHARAVGELTRPHAPKEVQVLLDRAVAVGAVPARLVEVAAVLARLFGRQVADVGLAGADQLLRARVELLEVVRGIEGLALPLESEPAHVLEDGVDVLDVLGGRVGVVEAQVARPVVLGRDAEVEADGLGVADVEVPVRLGRKARVHATAVLPGGQIRVDEVLDEVGGGALALGVLVGHGARN